LKNNLKKKNLIPNRYMKQHITSFCYALVVLLWCTSVHSQDILWEKSLGGKHADYLFDAVPTADYGFLLAGSSLSGKTGKKTEANIGDLDYWLWKMNEKGELEWQKSFGGNGSDLLQSIKLTRDAGFILVGTSDSAKGLHKKDSCRGKEDIWILKLNAQGGEEWQKTIGGSSQEMVNTVAETSDGGYIIGASSSSDKSGEKEADGRGAMDYWIIKLDNKGKIEWQKTYGGIFNDFLKNIEPTYDGGYIVGGYSNSPESKDKTEKNYGIGDYWIIKLDNKGEIVWQKTIGGDKDDQLQTIIQTKEGDYLLGGNSNSGISNYKSASNTSGTDFWVIKLDKTGEISWQETYNFGKLDILTSIVEEKEGTFILAGFAKSEVAGSKKQDKEDINDYAIIKIKPNGEEIWKKTVGSAGEEIMQKVIVTRDGGYLLTGTSNGKASRDKKSTVGSNDFWVVKLKNEKKTKEEKAAIEAFPNPTTQFTNVIIGYEYEKGTCAVYDLGGRQLQRFDIAKERTIPVDLGNLPQGIYIIEINTDVQKDGVKVMKSINKI
jgi:hypothetical protein